MATTKDAARFKRTKNIIELWMKYWWGERCAEPSRGCVLCNKWREFDKFIESISEGVE